MEVENITTADEARAYLLATLSTYGQHETVAQLECALKTENSEYVEIESDGTVMVGGDMVLDDRLVEVVSLMKRASDARSYVATCVDMSGSHYACLNVEDALEVEHGSAEIDEDGYVYINGEQLEDEKLIEVAAKI